MGVALFEAEDFEPVPVRSKPIPLVLKLPSIESVIAMVATHYRVSVSDILAKDRHKTLAEARNVAYWLARRVTRASYPEIARAFGGRDHTSVMSGCRRIERKLEQDRARWSPFLAKLIAEAERLVEIESGWNWRDAMGREEADVR